MARILQSFVYISVIVASVNTQRDFYRPSAARFYNEPHSYSQHLQKRVAFQDDAKIGDRIVFEKRPTRQSNSLDIPEECKKQGYCENVPNYPTEAVKNLISSLGDQGIKFQMDKLDNNVQIAQRLGGAGEELELEMCNFSEKIIYPQSVPDADGNWHTVINLKDNPQQGFRTEICNEPKSSCNGIANLQEGYGGGCKQKYFYRMMSVIDEHGKHSEQALRLPSCCSCVLTSLLRK